MNTKRLYRSRQEKMLNGVCGGIAEYFNLDPTLIRLGWAMFMLIGCGTGLLAYVVAGFIIPEKKDSF